MKVVLDTNVIVAAFAVRGFCTAVYEYVLASESLVVCQELFTELQRIFSKKLKLPQKLIDEILKDISIAAEIVVLDKKQNHEMNCRDPKDRYLINLSLQAKVDYLVTGDQDLLVMQKEYSFICSPRQFWEHMKKDL